MIRAGVMTRLLEAIRALVITFWVGTLWSTGLLVAPLLFIGSVLLSIFAFISFGLIIAPLFIMYRGIQQWQNAMEFPVYILAGFLFPIAMLPGWTTPISYILPPFWAARALHETSTGGADLEKIMLAWGMMLFFSVIDLLIASRLFKVMLYKARVDATLETE